ncbi:MAG: FtsX-like permease family protein [Pseudomonadota bacterium]
MALAWLRRDGPPIVPNRGWAALLTGVTAAAMGFLAVLSLAAGIAAGRLAQTWQAELAEVATVSITAERTALDPLIDRAVEVLRTTPGIALVKVLSAEEHAALLEPWLGEAARIEDLPAPWLIEVELDGAGPDIPALQARLDASAPGARYDDHQAWRGPLADAADALETLAITATGLVVLAAAGMIGLAAQATLAGNAEVVRVVRLIGAEERYILHAFITRIALRGLIGGGIGALAGAGALALLPETGEAASAGLSLAPGPGATLALVAAVPLGTMAVAILASWLAIRAELRRMP